ncbi:unnamed protein product [Adineta steineri]|uniref:J domain-containing protein n=1 Tax=Adineta steineri TaxID=433720 RepID=A0A818ML12_9BILA|nr:unnamed protein product [Adineta steineri]
MHLEYDMNGEMAFYFMVPFVVFILMIITCCSWSENEEISSVLTDHNQYRSSQVNKSNQKRHRTLVRIGLIVVWIVLFIVVYYMSPTIDHNLQEFDPFLILDVDEEASNNDIRHAYHELSKQHHPDQGGDPENFKKLVKAYKILTDETAKENWRMYGNPDGQKELHLGYAIPSWFFDTKNSMFILCAYTSIFIIFARTCCLCC